MSEFKVGDVVWLKSGDGPPMNIRAFREDNECQCDWFEGKKRLSGRFAIDQLTTEKPDDLATGHRL